VGPFGCGKNAEKRKSNRRFLAAPGMTSKVGEGQGRGASWLARPCGMVRVVGYLEM
jgi:hypothetical protein